MIATIKATPKFMKAAKNIMLSDKENIDDAEKSQLKELLPELLKEYTHE